MTSWWLVFTIAFLFGGFYLISRLDGPLTIGGAALSPSSLYASYAGISLILLLFSGATGAIFWIIGMLTITYSFSPSIHFFFWLCRCCCYYHFGPCSHSWARIGGWFLCRWTSLNCHTVNNLLKGYLKLDIFCFSFFFFFLTFLFTIVIVYYY